MVPVLAVLTGDEFNILEDVYMVDNVELVPEIFVATLKDAVAIATTEREQYILPRVRLPCL